MSNVVDIRTRREYISNLVAEAGYKAGAKYRMFSDEAMRDIEEAQAKADIALKNMELELGRMGIKVPKGHHQLRLL